MAAALPAILYGSEIWVLGKKEVDRVEIIQREVARVMLGGHKGRHAKTHAFQGLFGRA